MVMCEASPGTYGRSGASVWDVVTSRLPGYNIIVLFFALYIPVRVHEIVSTYGKLETECFFPAAPWSSMLMIEQEVIMTTEKKRIEN